MRMIFCEYNNYIILNNAIRRMCQIIFYFMRIQSYLILFYEYQKSLIIFTKSLENQFIYPYPKGSKLILTSSSSPDKSGSVLRSPWGRGRRRKSMKYCV